MKKIFVLNGGQHFAHSGGRFNKTLTEFDQTFFTPESGFQLKTTDINETYDYITTRAVAPLKTILEYAVPKLKKGGYFIAYKSKNTQEELAEAKNIIKKLKVKLVDTIEYTLPLEQIYERNLIIFQK